MISKLFAGFAVVIVILSPAGVFSQSDLVDGNLIQFNDNGAWCWYQDERAIVDTIQGKLIFGSDASGTGIGGSTRNGNIEGTIYDLKTGSMKKTVFWKPGCDDHNTPAFLIRPDGKYIAMYAGHNSNNLSYYRIYDGAWGPENSFNWDSMPSGTDFATTYSNLFYLANESKVYNIARSNARSPNMMVSTDLGNTWSYGGLLTEPDISIGYVNGYFKYYGNGVDRIDFVCTEHHPRDYNTSIYHGYIQNGQSFKSDGTLIDSDITDQTAPKPADFTPVFLANTVTNGDTMRKIWNADLVRYDDGTIAAILTCRINNAVNGNDGNINPDHAFIYCRYNGANWSYTYLGQAGKKLYSSEADYTGLGALDPSDPNTIYISTHIDPRTDIDITYREIFKGVTTDNGASWSWTPITRNSNEHNFRPIVPAWNESHTALLWFRGTYNAAQTFDAAIVGILQRSSEEVGLMHYVDATSANTSFSDGSPLVTTGPDPNQGPADDQWHERTGYGNGGSVLTSAEIDGENAPVLKTMAIVQDSGTYDVWVNFWANPTEDWRVRAGLSDAEMQIFRQMASKQVQEGDHDSNIVLSGGGNTFLYQAYLGRIQAFADDTIDILVDDYAIQTGTSNILIGGVARTWYDGISYAIVNSNPVAMSEKKPQLPDGFSLSQNYPNPFNPTTTIHYSLPRNGNVTLTIYDLLGQKVRTLVNSNISAGQYTVVWDGRDEQNNPVSSGIYFYRLSAISFVQQRKMVLLR